MPVALDGEPVAPVELVERLNALGGRHGVGRIDHVEDRLVGIKSREIYEAPAARVLHTAHAALEGLTLSKEQLRFNRLVATSWRRPPTTASGSARSIATCASTCARRSASSTARSGCASTTAPRSSSAGAATTRSTTARWRRTTRRRLRPRRARSASSASSACRSNRGGRARLGAGRWTEPLLAELPVTVTERRAADESTDATTTPAPVG